ncbi:MAG TPA: hypothetical protein GXZ89_08785 [Fastidiosipila sp.]|nr:hypothetical protein [Fastidiosipila sp.]
MHDETKNSRTLKWLLTVFFFLTASIPLLFLALGIDSSHFASEQRPLPPEIIVDDRFNESFTSQFDDYWARSFPLNSFLVSRYNWLTGHITSSSTNQKVIWGKDGYLFFKETLDDALKVPTLSDQELSRIITSLRLQKEYAEARGATFHFLIAPNKAAIYPEYLPSFINPLTDVSNAKRLLRLNESVDAIDLFSLLTSLKEDNDGTIYHRLDSHWNNIGALGAYRELMTTLGLTPLEIGSSFQARNDFQGDLATMYYPDREVMDEQLYASDFESVYVPLRPIRTLEDITIETMRPDKEGSLLMFRDSFANALIPYLSSSIGQVTYLRQTKYDYRMLDRKRPEHVVLQIVERNLAWLLQGTPIMPAPEVEIPLVKGTIEMGVEISETEAAGMTFINAAFDRSLDYDRVIVAGERIYEAFPLYDDGVVDDDVWRAGFSLYVDEPLDDMTVYVRSAGEWYELTSAE